MLAMLAVVVVSAFYVYQSSTPIAAEARIRAAGAVLQVLGILTVVYGLNETRKLFRLPGILAGAWRWIRACPWRGPRRIFGSGAVSPLGGSLTATGTVTGAMKADATPEERLSHLDLEIARIDKEIDDVRANVARNKAELRAEFGAKTQDLDANQAELARVLALAQTGGINLSLAGLVWLAVGVVLTSIPTEIARALGLA